MMGLGSDRRVISLLVVMLVAVSVHACRIMDRAGDLPEPWIEAAPLGQSAGQWKLLASDTELTVTAPGAEKVKLLYKPGVAVERHAELKTLAAPAQGRGEFLLEWRPGPDFVGDVWAEAYYLGGAVKKTEPLPLATEEAISSRNWRIAVMKLKVLAFVSLSLLAAPVFAGQTWVDGYYRSDGTYVRPHVRSSPNSTRYDNFGPGSNPYTPYGRDSDRDGMWNQYDMDDDNDGYSDDYEY